MRENRSYGSEGGEGQPFPTPIGTQGQGKDVEAEGLTLT